MRLLTKRRVAIAAAFSAVFWLAGTAPSWADSLGGDLGEKIPGVDGLTHGEIGLNLLWIIIGAILVIFMQAGFALVETGFCRAKHTTHVVSTNFAVFGLGFVAFFLVGYTFMFGGWSYPGYFGYDKPLGDALIGSGNWVFLWKGGFALSGAGYDVSVMAMFLYMVAFMPAPPPAHNRRAHTPKSGSPRCVAAVRRCATGSSQPPARRKYSATISQCCVVGAGQPTPDRLRREAAVREGADEQPAGPHDPCHIGEHLDRPGQVVDGHAAHHCVERVGGRTAGADPR